MAQRSLACARLVQVWIMQGLLAHLAYQHLMVASAMLATTIAALRSAPPANAARTIDMQPRHSLRPPQAFAWRRHFAWLVVFSVAALHLSTRSKVDLSAMDQLLHNETEVLRIAARASAAREAHPGRNFTATCGTES